MLTRFCSWTKVSIPFGNSHPRDHTCHAVGEQLFIVGGYPPGEVVDETAPCDNQLVKVFNMRNPGVSMSPAPGGPPTANAVTTPQWKSRYELNTVYKTPQQVIDNAGLNLTGNRSPRKGWADKDFGAAFSSCVSNRSIVEAEALSLPRGLPLAGSSIWLIVVGSVLGLVAVIAAIFVCTKLINRMLYQIDSVPAGAGAGAAPGMGPGLGSGPAPASASGPPGPGPAPGLEGVLNTRL